MLFYLCFAKHESDSDQSPSLHRTEEGAIKKLKEHFESYGFIIKDNKPFDPEFDDGKDGGFTVFDNVIMKNGELMSFMHCGGEGPVGWIEAVTDQE